MGFKVLPAQTTGTVLELLVKGLPRVLLQVRSCHGDALGQKQKYLSGDHKSRSEAGEVTSATSRVEVQCVEVQAELSRVHLWSVKRQF